MPLNWELINADALAFLDLDGLVDAVSEKECRAFGDVLTPLLKDEETWSPAQLEAMRFAGAVLMMMLRPSQPAEPFGPMFVMGGNRSAIPEDFPRPVVLGLVDWAMAMKDPELRARFLDLIWVQGKSFPAAQGAVEAYVESAKRLEHPKEWPPCADRFERALRIAAGLGRGGLSLRDKVLAEIDATVARHRGEDPLYLTHRLTRLLLEFRYGENAQLAQWAAAAAEAAEKSGEFWRARDYYQLAADCFDAAGDAEAKGGALRRAAEVLVLEAEAAVPQSGRGAMAAASILAQAVDAMRQAPGGKERAAALHERMLELQPQAMSEMKSVSTTIDTTELVESALEAVRGKTFRDSAIALCGMSRPPSLEQLLRQVAEQARVAVLGSMFQSDIVNSRGRVVAKAPPLLNGVTDPTDEGVRVRMFQSARLARNLTVQAMINPARQEIVAAHNPSRQDVVTLIRNSPWVPSGHAESIARALVAGFHGDMLVAGHLVPPQIEALVRHVVESSGGITTMLDPNGLQPERPLMALLDTEEALRAFGEAGVFELKDLLVDPLGSNLRNEVAHGLLDDEGLFGGDMLYAWWLLLRCCVWTALQVERQQARSAADSASEGGAGAMEAQSNVGSDSLADPASQPSDSLT